MGNEQKHKILFQFIKLVLYFHHLDLIAQVFQFKKAVLCHKEWVMGKVVAYVDTIKFQKQVLPHMHLL